MSFVVTPAQMQSAEQAALESGRSEPSLMRDAAEGIAAWLDTQFHAHDEERIALGLVGPGKNGGDTLTVLALLAELGWTVHACGVDRDAETDLPAEQEYLNQIAIVDSPLELAAAGEVIVLDGLYGLGGRADLPANAITVLEAVRVLRRAGGVAVIAIDVPSGVDCETGAAADGALQADATLTIGALKSGLMHEPAATLAGEVVVIEIGLDFTDDNTLAALLNRSSIAELLPQRRATSGKHDHGGLLVIGGAPTYFGAPRLAGEAALRVGTGLVGAAVPRMLIPTIAVQVPEIVYVPISDSDARKSGNDITEALTDEHSRYTAAVLGPGLGQDEAAKALLAHLFGQASKVTKAAPIGFGVSRTSEDAHQAADSALASVPLVLDADALNWLAEQDDKWSFLERVAAVLTPHPGEMARLRGVSVEEIQNDRLSAALQTASESGQTVVLKGGYTIVAAPDGRYAFAQRPTPELATPGTGDVLAGVIGGLLAQGLTPYDAACAGVYIGAEAGRLARLGVSSRSVLARDLIGRLGSALDELDASIW